MKLPVSSPVHTEKADLSLTSPLLLWDSFRFAAPLLNSGGDAPSLRAQSRPVPIPFRAPPERVARLSTADAVPSLTAQKRRLPGGWPDAPAEI